MSLLKYYLDENGKRAYTLQGFQPEGSVIYSAHPAKFTPQDQYSRHRVTIKKRYGLLPYLDQDYKLVRPAVHFPDSIQHKVIEIDINKIKLEEIAAEEFVDSTLEVSKSKKKKKKDRKEIE